MILFFISFCLVFLSAYLLTGILLPKKSNLGFLYLIILGFAQVVLSFEILSLFTAIGEVGLLGLNCGFALLSYYFWLKAGKPLWGFDLGEFVRKFKNALALDKSLRWLGVGVLFFILVSIFLCFISPANSADGYSYHVVRSLFWLDNANLNHFGISDIRALCMPINSEILYTWVFLFLKKDLGLGVFSFGGYLLCMVSIFNILSLMGYSLRKKLWVVFILSSFSGVIAQASGIETDIIVAGLVLACVNLFWYGIKNSEKVLKTPIFIAALAYALAIGVKTTAIIAIPAVSLFLILISRRYWGKEFYKPLGLFLGFGIINFLAFSSYNYVLNFLNYGNFIGAKSIVEAHRNIYGLAGGCANFIKNLFLFFDFSSFRWSEYVGDWILGFRNAILGLLGLGGLPDGIYTTKELVLNNKLLDVFMLGGILGFLVYLPAWIWVLLKSNLKSRKMFFLFLFAMMLLVNILAMSFNLAFMTYSVRFLLFFVILSSPILVLTSFSVKNPMKYIIIFFALSNLFLITTHLNGRPFLKILEILKTHSITQFRYIGHCRHYYNFDEITNDMCTVSEKLVQKYPKYKRVIVFVGAAEYYYHLKKMMFDGYEIDFGDLENIDKIDLKQYDLAIISGNRQDSTVVHDFENRINFYDYKGSTIQFDQKYEAPCLYFDNQKHLIIKGENKTPFLAQCFVTPQFLKSNNLRQLEVLDVYYRFKNEHKVYEIYLITK